MKFVFVCSLCCFLMQTSLGRVLSERQLDNNLNQQYRTNRGVTYVRQPSSLPSRNETSDTSDPPRNKGQTVNYDIFEAPDERVDGPVGVAPPGPSQPAGLQLPPKLGPVLFPDEEAAAQNNGNIQDGKTTQEGQKNQDTKNPDTVVNPPQGHGNNRNNGKKNTEGSQQRGNSSGNRGNNSSNRNGSSKIHTPANNSQNGNNGNRYGNNGNGNGNGRGNGRKNCSFTVDMFLCVWGR